VFIRHFVVDAPERGRGVGRALFEALEDEYGSPQFRLDVMEGGTMRGRSGRGWASRPRP
jgi:GNAT superfamily N-acetyltransferase